MSDLIDTTEMYLRTVYELLEEGVPPLRARIAERLHQSGPTVSQTVARMERDGLLVVEEDRRIRLSDEGFRLARAVMRKHRLAECLLTEVIGLEWDKVHDEACRWEHVISADVERRLVEILDSPHMSPYGNPIPGLDELGVEHEPVPFRRGVQSLAEHLDRFGDGPATLERMSENVQANPDSLQGISALGLRPGAGFEARRVRDGVELKRDGAVLFVDAATTEQLFVTEER